MQPPPRVCYFQLLNENIDYYNVIKQALIKTSRHRQLNFIKFNSNQYLRRFCCAGHAGILYITATDESDAHVIQKAHTAASQRNSE